jgi:hypothetical protein
MEASIQLVPLLAQMGAWRCRFTSPCSRAASGGRTQREKSPGETEGVSPGARKESPHASGALMQRCRYAAFLRLAFFAGVAVPASFLDEALMG